MRDIRNAVRAERDLIDIWFYTSAEWGDEQADEYLRQIGSGLARLIDHPNLGKDRGDLREGYRSLSINRHVAFYIVESEEVVVVRILHQGMDLPSHL